MKLIEPIKYYSSQTFQQEKERIFETQWLFACLSTDVPKARDYALFEIMGRSVIIYNTGKTIKAFQNVCPHRFNHIFNKETGNGPLVCMYHLWGFGENGELLGQGRKNLCAVPEGTTICLKQYQLNIIGSFIFIHFSDTPTQTIDEQLGSIKNELILISEVISEKIHENAIPHNTNWKFIVENTIETQHCKALHQETLVKAGFCNLMPEEQGKISHNSYFIIPPLDNEERQKRDKMFNKYLTRPISNNRYKHILVFPNLNISIFEGINITLGQIVPVSPEQTIFKLKYYTSKLLTDSAVAMALMDEMKGSTISFGNKVFEEDKAVLENLQKGVKEIQHSGYMYESEERVKWFVESYNDLMN